MYLFGDSPVTDLAFFDQLGHRLRHGLRLYLRIDPVLIVEIDVIRPQSPETLLDAVADGFRSAVELKRPVLIVADAHLCGDDHLIPNAPERFPDDLFIVGNASVGVYTGISFRRVKKSYPISYALRSAFLASPFSIGSPDAQENPMQPSPTGFT